MVTKTRKVVNELYTHTHTQRSSINIIKEENKNSYVHLNTQADTRKN